MKKIFTPLIAAVLLIAIPQNPVLAQTALNETTTTTDIDKHDNSSNWGLLGLAGLIGLIGKKKSEKTGRYTNTNSSQKRYSTLFMYF